MGFKYYWYSAKKLCGLFGGVKVKQWWTPSLEKSGIHP